MRDEHWINEKINNVFTPGFGGDMYLRDRAEKLSMCGGKLYKYFSFSKDDTNHSLENLRDNIIYFSKPEMFNDPFDCVMGLSIDDLIKPLVEMFISRKIGDWDDNSELTHSVIKSMLYDDMEPIESREPIIKLLKFIIKDSSFNKIIQKAKKKEIISQEEAEEAIKSLISNPSKLMEIVTIISGFSSNAALNTTFDINSIIKVVPNLISDDEIRKLLLDDNLDPKGIIRKMNAEKGILNKVGSLLTEPDRERLMKEIENFERGLPNELNKIKKRVNELMGISCFAERSDNILMWSHYADKHKGFCVEYDLSKAKNINTTLLLFPVKYSKKRANLPMDIFDFGNPNGVKVKDKDISISKFINIFLTKSDIWEYEEEWRIICLLQSLEEQKLYEDMISKVYLGANIKPEDESRIYEILQDKNDIEIIKYSMSNDSFCLVTK